MPATTVTCPSCNTTLKPKTPLPAGARVKCPKCQTAFVVPGDAPAPAPAPKPAAAKPATPKPAPKPADEEPAEVTEAADAPAGAAAPGGGGFKDKLKKVPIWGWIVGGVAGMFLFCGCCGGVGWTAWSMFGGGMFGSAVTIDNYNKVKKNMSEADVKKIMGGEPSLSLDIAGTHSDTWKGSGEDFITIQFQKDKAVLGAYEISKGPLKQSASGALP